MEPIGGMELHRAAVINDVIADEHGLDRAAGLCLGKQLGVDVDDLMAFAAAYAIKRMPGMKVSGEEARLAITMAFSGGVMSALRAVKIRETEYNISG